MKLPNTRLATHQDLARILEVSNWTLLHLATTFDSKPQQLNDWEER